MSIALLGNKTDMKRKAGALVLTAAALAFSSLSQPARAQDESGLRAPIEGLRAPIEGTWILQVHRVTQNFTFTALQSFTAGGVTLAPGNASARTDMQPRSAFSSSMEPATPSPCFRTTRLFT
jgi:hypothetical protein